MTIVKNHERRSHLRVKHPLPAVCEVLDNSYKARIFEMSRGSMTLLTEPMVPPRSFYSVLCNDGEQSGRFVVHEVQRIQIERKRRRFLRIGLEVVGFDDTASGILKGIERDGSKPPNFATSFGYGRRKQRLKLDLPASVIENNRNYKLRIRDMSAEGIGLTAPINFPNMGVYDLSFYNHHGDQISFLAQERFRERNEQNDQLLLGVQVIGGIDVLHQLYEELENQTLPES